MDPAAECLSVCCTVPFSICLLTILHDTCYNVSRLICERLISEEGSQKSEM